MICNRKCYLFCKVDLVSVHSQKQQIVSLKPPLLGTSWCYQVLTIGNLRAVHWCRLVLFYLYVCNGQWSWVHLFMITDHFLTYISIILHFIYSKKMCPCSGFSGLLVWFWGVLLLVLVFVDVSQRTTLAVILRNTANILWGRVHHWSRAH